MRCLRKWAEMFRKEKGAWVEMFRKDIREREHGLKYLGKR